MEHLRKMAVAGTFYPRFCFRIKQTIAGFNRNPQTASILKEVEGIHPRAAIVPHAGYIYSGFTANLAYRTLQSVPQKRFIVIGPSHKHYFQGISAAFYERFQTPCGDLPIDTPYLFALAKRFNIGFVPQAHAKEHSTEVQMPFLRYYFPDSHVIELVYGDIDYTKLATLMVALLQNSDNTLIISSDLSHFHPLKEANRIDRHCIDGVAHLDLDVLRQCEACGEIGIKAVTLAAKQHKLTSKVLHYTTSADYSHDTRSVVGYMSAVFA